MAAPIHFDHQAGAPLSAAAREAMAPFLDGPASPASLHRGGLAARGALAQAREAMAALIGARPDEILFTSGGTESVNLALFGHLRAARRAGDRRGHLVVAATEHAAVLRVAERLREEGFSFTLVPVDRTGRVDPQALADAVRPETLLAAVHAVNPEIGTIQPVAELAAWCGERKIAFFSDAAAAVGAVPLDVKAAPVTLLSLNPRLFGGPAGVGVLYRRAGTALEPLLFGGNQEEGLRAGTENVAAIAGAGAAAVEARKNFVPGRDQMARVQRRFWEAVRVQVPDAVLHGPELGPARSVRNLNFSVAGIEGEAQALLCDLRGLLVASGAACVSRDLRVSHVLRAIGLPPDLATANLVATFGPENTEEEADRAATIYGAVIAKLRAASPRFPRAGS